MVQRKSVHFILILKGREGITEVRDVLGLVPLKDFGNVAHINLILKT